MSIRNLTTLHSNSASVTDLKRIQTPHSLCQAAEFKFKSNFEPLQVIWQTLQWLFQKVMEGLEGKINGQALGATLWHCMGGSDGQAQTQGISKSAAVAAGLHRNSPGKHATTLAILTQFKSQKSLNAL